MKNYKMGFWVLVGLVIAMSGCSQVKVGGMTAQDAFHDPATAAWVNAVDRGNFKKADYWLGQGAKVNLVGTQEITPLLWIMGARRPSVRYLEYMLKAGADPNYVAPDNLGSAMYFAAGGDNPDILRLFLRYKGNPNLVAPDPAVGESRIIFIAALQQRLENIKLLLKYGADINWEEKGGFTVADTAIAVGRFDIAYYCLL